MAQDKLLEIDEIKTADVTASFDIQCSASQSPDAVGQMRRVTTKGRKFALHFDPRTIVLGKFGQFFLYTFFLEDLQAGQKRWYQCTAQVSSRGAFLDRNIVVLFRVSHGANVDEGELELPVHSIAKQDFIGVVTRDIPAKANLSSPSGLEVTVHNLLSEMDVVVDGKVQVSSDHPNYWKAVGLCDLGDGKQFRVRAGETRVIQLQIEPKKLPALLSTLTSVKPDGQHERLNVEVSYASDFGGPNRILLVPIQVRFVPSLASLVVALFAGSFLGTIAGQLLPNAWQGTKTVLKTAAKALVFSLVAELFAMLLVALGSRFVIIQFDLDPWQFLPVFFIGFVVSGGKEVLKYLGFTKQSTEDKRLEEGT